MDVSKLVDSTDTARSRCWKFQQNVRLEEGGTYSLMVEVFGTWRIKPFSKPLRIQICPKKGITSIFLFWGWDVSTINPRPGSAFLGIGDRITTDYKPQSSAIWKGNNRGQQRSP